MSKYELGGPIGPRKKVELPSVANESWFPVKQATPAEYQRYIPKDKAIVRSDLKFFEAVVGKYSLSTTRDFSATDFSSALDDVTTYVSDLRTHLDGALNREVSDLPADASNEQYRAYKSGERIRPSMERVQPLAELFLHYPPVKRAYSRLQSKKMELAFPGFVEQLDFLHEPEKLQTTDTYFRYIEDAIVDNQTAVLDELPEDQVDKLDILVGLQEQACMIPTAFRKRHFAGLGVRTFTGFLKEVVTDSVQNKKDVPSAVRREFLEHDGVGYQLMRMHIGSFAHDAKPRLEGLSMDDQRGALSGEIFDKGTCPAIFKMPTKEAPEGRPIAYEYASTIVKNIPDHLLQK